MTLRSSLNTKDRAYSSFLLAEETTWWKKLLDVQRPYRWNLRRLNPCFTLDLGCGIGRNLINLNRNGIGIDHNEHSVEIACARGLRAYTPAQFHDSSLDLPERFDSILLSHVVEHMSEAEAAALLSRYLHLLKPQGLVIFMTPQECGHRTDPTHVQFMDFERLRSISRESGLVFVKEFSFPFPRAFGRIFRYNEFVSISKKP